MDEIDLDQYFSSYLQLFDDNIYLYLEKKRLDYIFIQDEENANYYWCLKNVFEVKKNYIKAYSYLEKKEYEKAWNLFDSVDICITYLIDNFDSEKLIKYGVLFIRDRIKEFQKLFPYYIFFSREAVILSETCSICEKKITIRNSCIHKPGKLYMGELCLRIVDKIDIKAVAIVKNPFDKYTYLKPVDKEYNYIMLETLMYKISGPFDNFCVEETPVKSPEYHKLGRNDKCACGSNIKYKYCCLNTDKELIIHKQIKFHHKIKNDNLGFVNSYK